MGRIRTIKPEFFRHLDLFKAEKESGLPIRVAFPGLWCVADREGRFKWQPEVLKLDILPFDDVDFSRVLDALLTREFIVKYEFNKKAYGVIPTFHDHQVINNRERPSVLPPPPENAFKSSSFTCEARVDDAGLISLCNAQVEREGEKEGEKERNTPKPPAGGPVDEQPEPVKKNGIPYAAIIDHLNQQTGKSFRADSKNTQKRIKAIWNRGFCLEDFVSVIDKKAAKWKCDPKMVDYLRPETLFGEKFESYLNESCRKPFIQRFSETTAQNILNMQAWMEGKDREEQEAIFGKHGIDGGVVRQENIDCID